jgi:hypothetical protein
MKTSLGFVIEGGSDKVTSLVSLPYSFTSKERRVSVGRTSKTHVLWNCLIEPHIDCATNCVTRACESGMFHVIMCRAQSS